MLAVNPSTCTDDKWQGTPPSHSEHDFSHQEGISCHIIEKQVRAPGEQIQFARRIQLLEIYFLHIH